MLNKERMPEHVAVIMDGNGRWAKEKGVPFTHRQEAMPHNMQRKITYRLLQNKI